MPEINTHIAGIQFIQGAGAIIADTPTGDPFTLTSEPENQYDDTAVKVMAEEKHVGYVPGFLSAKVTEIIASGRLIKVIKTDPKKMSIEYEAVPDVTEMAITT